MDKKRFFSLDIFRGMTILLMIVLNNQTGRAIFGPLLHSPGDGITLADMAFPFFLFIVGAALYFSAVAADKGRLPLGKIVRRTAILFAVGLILNWLPFHEPLSQLRIPGVLQRIALAYCFGALIVRALPRRSSTGNLLGALFVGLGLLALYGGIIALWGRGVVGRVDVAIFGARHLYSPTFDPEGLLSTIPSISSVLLGYVAAALLARARELWGILLTLCVGAGFAAAGYLSSDTWPMNKLYWTGTFVLFTTGCGMLLWALLSLVVEYYRATRWGRFFAVAGTNSLYIYALSIALAKFFGPWGVSGGIYGWYVDFLSLSPPVASLLWSLTMVAVCWLLTWPLYRKRIFLSA